MKVACLYFQSHLPLHKIAEVFLRLSPQICLGKSALFIEIGKCHRLYSEQGFQARCQVLLKRLKLQARVSIGQDISEAFVMAKYFHEDLDHLPLQALVDLADPFEKDLLLQKNVQAMVDAFQYLGVNTLAQFKKIPLPELISRFGAISILCMQRLRHEITTPWIFWKPEEITCEKDDFPYFEFYGELEPILFKLKEQLDRIFQRLWGRQLWIQKLQVRLFFETNSIHPHPFRNFEFDFVSPQSSTKATLNIVKERLTRDFEKVPVRTSIQTLESKVLIAVPGKTGQKNLLNNHEEQLEKLQAILAQLAEAHGKSNIFQTQLTEDRRPEKSWCKIERLIADSPETSGKVPLRPTKLLHPPLKVTIQDNCVFIQNKKFKIKHWPEFYERISGDWFEKSYARNYYQVDLIDAPSICVFQTDERDFYLHGYYG